MERCNKMAFDFNMVSRAKPQPTVQNATKYWFCSLDTLFGVRPARPYCPSDDSLMAGISINHSWFCDLLRINTLHVAEWSKQSAYYIHIQTLFPTAAIWLSLMGMNGGCTNNNKPKKLFCWTSSSYTLSSEIYINFAHPTNTVEPIFSLFLFTN